MLSLSAVRVAVVWCLFFHGMRYKADLFPWGLTRSCQVSLSENFLQLIWNNKQRLWIHMKASWKHQECQDKHTGWATNPNRNCMTTQSLMLPYVSLQAQKETKLWLCAHQPLSTHSSHWFLWKEGDNDMPTFCRNQRDQTRNEANKDVNQPSQLQQWHRQGSLMSGRASF